MSNQEYEQKRRECWENFWDEISGNIDFAPGVDDRMKEHIYDTFDRAYALGKETETITQEDVGKAAEKYAINVNDKRLSAYPEQFRPQLSPEYDVTDLVDAFVAGANFALGKQENDADTVISGWVARDEDDSLTLFYGSDKPSKKDNDDYWSAVFGNTLEYLPQEMFPDIKWEDAEPTKVELIIKRKKNG